MAKLKALSERVRFLCLSALPESKARTSKSIRPFADFYYSFIISDIDECSKNSDTCHSNATCNNNPGSYDCQCRNGYTGNGHTCTGIGRTHM